MSLLLSTLAGLVAGELLLGGWLGERRFGGLRVLRGVSVEREVTDWYPREAPIHYTRDERGLRGAPRDLSTVDLLTLGGSTTDQIYLDDAETWQARLEQLAAAEGQQLRVVNAGLDGQTTVGHRLALESWLPELEGLSERPAGQGLAVLVYAGVNDFYLPTDADPATWSATRRFVAERSLLLHLGHVLGGWWAVQTRYELLGHRQVDWGAQTWTHQGLHPDAAALVAPQAAAFGERLRGLLPALEALGARPIFVTQRFAAWERRGEQVVGVSRRFRMAGAELNGVDVHAAMGAFNEATRAVCAEVGGTCVDVAETCPIPSASFYDWVHPDPEGTAVLAGCLWEGLHQSVSRGRIPLPPKPL